MKRTETIRIMLGALSLIGVMSIVPAGAEISNASITAGTATSYNGPAAAEHAAATGGFITSVDITSDATTANWQGYYGNLTGNIVLANAAGNQMYSWDMTSITGQVYATQDSAMNASKWGALVNQTGSSIDTIFGLGTASDNGTNTFDQTSTDITVDRTNPIGAKDNSAVKTLDGEVSPGSTWETIALAKESPAAAADFVFAGVIRNDQKAFDGTTADFQMIVPAKANADYYFYTELT